MNKVYSFSDEEFIKIVNSSKSYNDCIKKLGYARNGRHCYDLLKKRMSELKLDNSFFEGMSSGNGAKSKYSLDEILIENSPYQSMGRLKIRLVKEHKLEYCCAICGNKGEWQGKQLNLQLDHINGKHNDHRIENLRFLCPNCHSQTETYCRTK